MFRRSFAAALAAVLMITTATLCGCSGSGPATIEEYASQHPDQVKSIEDEIASLQTDMLIPSVEYDGNTVVMILTLTETFEEEDLIETLSESFEEGMEEQKVGETIAADTSEISEELGIDDIKVRIELRNGDGSVIWTETYEGEEDN